MIKKISCVLAALALALMMFMLPASAAPQTMLMDEAGLLSAAEAAALDQRLMALADKYQCDTIVATVDSAGGAALKELMDERYTGSAYGRDGRDCLMLLIDVENKSWRLASWGDMEAIDGAGLKFLNERLKEDLFEGDDAAALGAYADWCERFHAQYTVIGEPYKEGFMPPADSAVPGVLERDPDALSLLTDEAKLLSAAEAAALEEKLAALSDQWDNDIVIVTVDSIGRATPEAFADDWFDYGGYGRGENYDGVLLLINMEERDWHISTCGYSIFAFTDAGIEFLGKQLIADGLSDGDYAKAFDKYADWCGKFFEQAGTGKPYDKGSLPKTPGDYAKIVLFGFGGGLVLALIVTGSMKKKLKTVQKKQQAADYLRPGSLQVIYANEQFLYRNVTRVKRETSSSGGGGSSTHSSSSGRSHGGGGGKF